MTSILDICHQDSIGEMLDPNVRSCGAIEFSYIRNKEIHLWKQTVVGIEQSIFMWERSVLIYVYVLIKNYEALQDPTLQEEERNEPRYGREGGRRGLLFIL